MLVRRYVAGIVVVARFGFMALWVHLTSTNLCEYHGDSSIPTALREKNAVSTPLLQQTVEVLVTQRRIHEQRQRKLLHQNCSETKNIVASASPILSAFVAKFWGLQLGTNLNSFVLFKTDRPDLTGSLVAFVVTK